MLSSLFIPAISAFICSFLFVPIVRRFALRINAVSVPGGRHIHQKPTPKLGGLAIVSSFFLVVLAILIVDPARLHFVSEQFWGIDKNLFGVLLGSLILVGTGFYDDLYDLNPWAKLALQLLAALSVVAFGVQIHWLSNPFGGSNLVLG